MRYDNQVVAVLTHQTALAAARKASPLEARLPRLCGRPAAHAVRGHLSQCGRPGDVAVQPRVGDGFIRLDVAGVVVFASPNALSAYHRMG